MTDSVDLLTSILKSATPEEVEKAFSAAGLDTGRLYPERRYKLVTEKRKMPLRACDLPSKARKAFVDVVNLQPDELPDEEAYKLGWEAVAAEYTDIPEYGWVEKAALGLTAEEREVLPTELVLDPFAELDGTEWALDRLYRSLLVDGYLEAAKMVKAELDGGGLNIERFMGALPLGYRDAVSRRYMTAIKQANVTINQEAETEMVPAVAGEEGSFEVRTTFKALLQDQKISYGVVYPNYDRTKGERDLQKEWAQEAVIEKAAHDFLIKYRQQDVFHDEKPGPGVPVESFIAPCDIHEFHGKKLDKPIRKGSWVMATKWSDEAWDMVKSGKITGYSIGGFKRIRRGGE